MPPTVAAVTPANAAIQIAVDAVVKAELTRSDCNDYEKIETSLADFQGGTLNSIYARAPGELALAKADLGDDFESDTIGQVPAGMTLMFGTDMTVQNDSGNKVVRHAPGVAGNAVCAWTAQGQAADVDVMVKWKMPTSVATDPGIAVRMTGSSYATATYYTCQAVGNGTQFRIYKCINGTATPLGSAISFSHTTATWYWLRFQISGTTLNIKLWAASGGQPGSWTYTLTDSSILQSGYFGVSGYATPSKLFDQFTIVNGASTYQTSGDRTSPPYSLAAAAKFASGRVEYDVTTPANTSVTIQISKDGTNWTTVANGDPIALWNDGDSLAAANIYTKQLLTTSDTGVTPTVSEIRLWFLPQDETLVELNVDGIACTLANGKLRICGKTAKDVSGTITDPCRQDMTYQTVGSWQAYSPKTVTLLVKYNGSTISTTTFTTLGQEDYGSGSHGSARLGEQGGMLGSFMAMASAALDGSIGMFGGFTVSSFEYWLVKGEAGFLIAEPLNASVDGTYYIAHPFRVDHPGSFVVGHPVPVDTPGSFVVQGWARSDTPGSFVVQGWIREDTLGSFVVAFLLSQDLAAGSFIVGAPIATDTPGSFVVYQVNDLNAIDVQVIDDIVAAMLVEMGITVL